MRSTGPTFCCSIRTSAIRANSRSENIVNFAGGAIGSSLWLASTDVTDTFHATITNFGPNDDINLLNIHGTSAALDGSVADQLDVFDAKGHTVATLQLDDTIPDDQVFSVSPSFGSGGGTDIRWENPSFAPTLTSALSGAVTDDTNGPPVETTTASMSFGDAVSGDIYPYFVRIEGDPPLGSLTVTGGPLAPGNTIVSLPGSGGTIGLTYTVSDSAIDFLSAGETKTDTFDVELSDGQATVVQPYSVVITGTNHTPVIGNIDLPTTLSANGVGGFALAGAAAISPDPQHPDDSSVANQYQLIPNDLGQAGAIWQKVDLSQDFTVHARLFFGNGILDLFHGGAADGITFALQKDGPIAIGPAGGDLGIGETANPGLSDAVGVKFDTFPFNANEPQINFAQFFTSGDVENATFAQNILPPNDLANGSWHDVVVTWDAATDKLIYTLDGVITDTLTQNLVAADFSGQSQVFAGFTGASGSAFSPEQVQVVSFSNGAESAADFVGGVTDIAGLTTAQVATAGNLTTGGTFDFSDVDQLDTHTAPVTNGTILSAPSYYTSGTELGTLTANVTQDTTGTGNGGQVQWNFSVADSDIAFLKAGDQIVETFNVNVADDHGGVTPQAVTVTITGSNNNATISATTPGSDQSSVTQFTALTATGSLTITDPDAGESVFQAETNVVDNYGAFSITSGGAWTFNLDDNSSGVQALNPGQQVTDIIQVTSLDGTATHNVDIVINGNNNPPVAVNDSYDTNVGTALSVSPASSGVLDNDTDPLGHAMNAALVSGPSDDSSFTFNSDGTFTYTPVAGFVGDDHFTYKSVDQLDSKMFSTATVTIHVHDTAPAAIPHSYSTTFDTALGVAAPGVLTGDPDANHPTLTAAEASAPSHGNLTLNSDGSFAYTPYLGFVGSDTFTYDSIDIHGTHSSSHATVSIAVNDAPNSFDFSTGANSSASWTVNLSANPEYAFNSGSGLQTLSGINNVVTGSGNNTIVGNNNGDVLIGGVGNDVIRGGTGNDIIVGGNGTNSLSGAGGNNTFVFTSGSFKTTISDFHVAQDTMDFEGFGLTINQILADASGAVSTVITLAPNEQITLNGVSAAALQAAQNGVGHHPLELNV